MLKSTLFSVVYKGKLGTRLVAVKLPKINPYETLDESLLRKFDREIDIWSKLKSDYVVGLIKFVKARGLPILVLEYCEKSLRDYLKERGRLDEDKGIRNSRKRTKSIERSSQVGFCS